LRDPAQGDPVTEISCQTPVQYLKTVGPVRARSLARLGVETVGDLLRHYPRRHFDRSTTTPIGKVVPGQEVTIQGEVMTAGERHTRRGGSLQTVAVRDSSGTIFCIWFNQPYLLRQLRGGMRIICSGTAQSHAGQLQLAHPDWESLGGGGDRLHTGRLVPQYPLTHGLGQHWLRRLVHQALHLVQEQLPEILPAELLRDRDLCGRTEALRQIHFPADQQQLAAARRRLVYEEVFLIQLAMALRRRGRQASPGIRLEPPGDLTRRLVQALPFRLTGAQRRVLAEILGDLRSGGVMHRLLQGEVGSGKTLVAVIAALFVIEQGHQAVIMAPTEVLARQHGRTLARLAEPLGISVATLSGTTPAAERRRLLAAAAAGETDLLVGTHALIQDDVVLPRLALVVVDEQHRFGVRQRGQAGSSRAGLPPHVLVMSATPIPRSLSLTLYGDLDLSVLDEVPAGRQPVTTHVLDTGREQTLYSRLREPLRQGRQAYIVYPVIEETEGRDLRAATVEYERLAGEIFPDLRLALLHGRLRPRQKEEVMDAFAAGQLDVLVATTVVEVGLDVPQATLIVIHHPERFGLAQLHQLRGRIARGEVGGHCFLLVDRWLAPETLERIRYFAAHTDGFRLAEEDLRRRGPGDAWGVRQHGAPGFRLANPLRDADLVKLCAEDAARVLSVDPDLTSPAGQRLRQAFQEESGLGAPLSAG
jgi:ATP-dependent DNA helicase RecG